jgi:hypothetical protein
MTEKRMLIVPAELVQKINENRGDLSQSDFLNFLIDSHFNEVGKREDVSTEQVTAVKDELTRLLKKEYVTKNEIISFQQDTKKLLKSFVDFFISYGLELGKESPVGELADLSRKLSSLDNELSSEEDTKVKLKWK